MVRKLCENFRKVFAKFAKISQTLQTEKQRAGVFFFGPIFLDFLPRCFQKRRGAKIKKSNRTYTFSYPQHTAQLCVGGCEVQIYISKYIFLK